MRAYKIQIVLIILGVLSLIGGVVSDNVFLSPFLINFGIVSVIGNILGILLIRMVIKD